MTNKELSRIFGVLADLMEIHGENSFKIRSYSNASFRLSRLEQQVSRLERNELEQIQGIGKAIADKIIEINTSGTLSLLEDLVDKTPDGVVELLHIKGVGPKKISRLWKELEITSPGELLYACKENRLVPLKGFGTKTQDKFIEAIEYYLQQKDKFLLHTALEEAELLKKSIAENLEVDEIIPTGQLRLKSMTIDSFAFLIVTDKKEKVEDKLIQSGFKFQTEYFEKKEEQSPAIKLYVTLPEEKEFHLFQSTGPDYHTVKINQLNEITKSSTEGEIYEKAGISFIHPQSRENPALFDYDPLRLKNTLEIGDFKGMIHAHSTYSDGSNSIKEMAQYCIDKGFAYLVITDHSRSAFYAGGLDEEKIRKQHREIDTLNATFNGFKIFKGIESDILTDGSLDYSDEILATFDCIIASIHSGFQMDADKATGRIIKAIENPYTHILGHMTGRLLLSRAGYPVHHEKIIDACAKNNVAIELNANPHRLDVDWKWLDYMLSKEVLLSINPDAHSTAGFEDTEYGIVMANKAFWPKQKLINCFDVNKFEQYLKMKIS